MFFAVTNKRDDHFPQTYSLGNLYVNVDDGWNTFETDDSICIFKGYADNARLVDLVEADSFYNQHGNFTVLQYNKQNQTITVFSDQWRAYRIWYSKDYGLSNLHKKDSEIWTDDSVIISQDLSIQHNVQDVIGDLPQTHTDLESVLNYAHNKLLEKTENFLKHNNLPLKVFLTSGSDTMLVYSYIQQLTNKYDMLWERKIEWNYFYMHNHQTIHREVPLGLYLHLYNDPCVLASGAPGDEFLVRNPQMVSSIARYYGVDFWSLFDESPNDYMKDHYEKVFYNYKKPFAPYNLDGLGLPEMVRHLANINANDAQHWHFCNTYTWTPLRDLDIFKQIVALPLDQLVGQITGAEISIELIKRNNPDLLRYMSPDKNANDYLKVLYPMMTKQLA